jgi:hypothetical protein
LTLCDVDLAGESDFRPAVIDTWQSIPAQQRRHPLMTSPQSMTGETVRGIS